MTLGRRWQVLSYALLSCEMVSMEPTISAVVLQLGRQVHKHQQTVALDRPTAPIEGALFLDIESPYIDRIDFSQQSRCA
ncbi:hypothetical protein CY34DRAFT_463032 [Suillus luteus UH-Slu-Lm8-n1]|uniref:Uncharacterized protein n=1 Tax=Suillus luteus UH-Slu-Lm8-n1 TaxID=930992 RepID=A0A0D0A6U3_9AGAM|nr:hypothetical protein CY34DRAFT_463032 [Suillus luteus UH-Slu-Lm8-n1]